MTPSFEDIEERFSKGLAELHRKYPDVQFDDDLAHVYLDGYVTVKEALDELDDALAHTSAIQKETDLRFRAATAMLKAAMDGVECLYMTKEFIFENVAFAHGLDIGNERDRKTCADIMERRRNRFKYKEIVK